MDTHRIIRGFFLLSLLVQWADSDETPREMMDLRDKFVSESTAVATTEQSLRHPRYYRRGDEQPEDHQDDMDMEIDDNDDPNAMSRSKVDYWGGYYDFLINEGSYKFWAVFQLATAALLIYSGFAALYYAKVNPSTNDDYDDFFLRRRRRRRDLFHGLGPETFQRILDAVSGEFQPQ